MTTYLEPTLLDMLAALAAEPGLPSRHTDEHIETAVSGRARRLTGGLVHISDVRPFITRDVAPHLIGAVLSGWAAQHGRFVGYRRNGDTRSGNGNKPAPVWAPKP